MTVFALDDFNSGSSGTDLSTSADWTKRRGGSDGYLRYTSTGALYGHYDECLYSNNTSPPGADYEVSVDVRVATKLNYMRYGVAARFDTVSGAHYKAYWRSTETSAVVDLLRMSSLTAGGVVATYSLDMYQYDTRNIALRCEGADLTVLVDGLVVCEYTDPSPIAAAGLAGIVARTYYKGSSTAGGHIDNFSASTIASERQRSRLILTPW